MPKPAASNPKFSENPASQIQTIAKFYRIQSKFYDLTRWLFLFGRKKIIKNLPFDKMEALRILEVGCGTGYNLENLARYFPNARLTGIDASQDMLSRAKKKTFPDASKVEFIHGPYGVEENLFSEPFDLILFSYSLTMINPQWQEVIRQARMDLKPGGCIAVVDFHDTCSRLLRWHMENSHVRMEGHLRPFLEKEYNTIHSKRLFAYLSLWSYFLFIGTKKA